MTSAVQGVDVGRRAARRLTTVLAGAVVVVAVDQATKQWALTALAGRPPRPVWWTLQWNLSFNQGMAFSAAQGFGPIIGLLAVAVAVAVARWVRHQPGLAPGVAAALVIGGAFGNVTDRLFRGEAWMRGAVVDFVDLQWFPIFNVADTAVNVGGLVFVVWALLARPDTQHAAVSPGDGTAPDRRPHADRT